MCIRCLKADHETKNCPSDRKCYYCDGEHLKPFCFKFFESNKQPVRKTQVSSIVECSSTSHEEENEKAEITPTLPSGEDSADEFCGARPSNDFTSPECGKKRVLFMCLPINVFNPANPKKKLLANVFLDSFSGRSFITESLSNALSLTTEKTESLSLGVFGSEKPQKFESDIVKIAMKSEFGEKIVLNLNKQKFLTMSVPAAMLKPEDLKSLDIEKEIDVQFVKPDIVLGIDDFNQIQVHQIKKLKNGFVLSGSRLGRFISGLGNVSNNKVQISSTVVMSAAVYETNDSIEFSKNPPDPENPFYFE